MSNDVPPSAPGDPAPAAVPPAIPADVVIARAVRAHTRALIVVLAAPLVLAGLGAAALSMAGPYGQDPPAVAGVTMIAQGQVLGVVAGVLVGRGLLTLLRAAGAPGSTASRKSVESGRPVQVLTRTIKNLATMIRVIIIAAVLGIVVWAIIDFSALAGAIVGAVLVAQVAVVVALARVGVLHRTLNTLPGAPTN